ncbi:hypothetical protein M231_05661 [Tremella mesenterica]|uniref:Uncharacterized protein n=1 Tax=Tremella mesenterica TaxID=5217 RepID=A0A4Q1BHI5_TREME|nr:hypothetical protein M231_05661 [Tremella mesenterica]
MVSNFQPTLFYTLLGIYHLLPLHAPLTLFVLDAPFGRFASKTSRLNVNGNIAWFSMEIVAPLTFLMTLYPTFPTGRQLSLSIMYLIHYAHRAVLSPLILSPKRSKLHIIVPLIAAGYNAL